MNSPNLIAVIPAAGRGLRLGTTTPKIFIEIQDGVHVYDVLLARLATVTDCIHVVLSPEGLATFESRGRPTPAGVHVTVSVQDEPRGMGDAVFGASAHWHAARHILIVWGDQLGVSATTLRRVASSQCAASERTITLPLVHRTSPYVHYELDGRRLVRIAQNREGESCPPEGLSDVGTFALATTGLEAAWERYLLEPEARGARTGEINLLPFFVHLARREGFAVDVVDVADPAEARGVNTPEDLAYFRSTLEG